MVMVLEEKEAVTPAGRPVGVPIPGALEVVCVMGVMAELTQTVGADEPALTVQLCEYRGSLNMHKKQKTTTQMEQ
jgi:hypothetical protein